MKTIKITLIALFTIIGLTGMSQNNAKTEARQAKKDSILIKKLDLTTEEKANFLPLFHQYQADRKALRQSLKTNKKSKKKITDMNDEEIEKVIQDSFVFKQKELDLKKQYHEKFKAVLPVKKLAKLYHLERKMKGKNHKGGKGKKSKQRTKK